jgi:two-component system sensor histidine kinase KdpD
MDTAEAEVVDLMLVYGARALVRARRYRSDRAAALELQDLDRRISGLLSTVSHELRTPLTVVQGLTATLVARWDALSDASRHELLGRIDANAERLGEMMSRLLESSYLHGGGFELRLLTVPARDLLIDTVERVGSLLDEHPVTIDADPGQRVRVDPLLMIHVLDNLVVNATVHTPPGSRVWLRARPAPGGRVEVEVADDGPGIAPQDRDLVLERFYRGGDDTHRAVTRGLGLGLSIAVDVVDAHGGRLRVASSAEGGASFSFDVAAG